ncbi:hypothetical protein P691DRAFT_761309 [Macrolepiota fuliginosa MF-IS2]|uniref:SH3 domain-containing protein n=1 Tax=Macrolepiota fuliginosa MF-IS2 TaxID=1400762 RepID=A0A9P6C0N8_9AGAR|nr:hypothetical protein P691DRAFT_761309 [Macrolepiota fuliginosa MF-IS2]
MDVRRPQRQDTYDLRDHLLTDDSDDMQAHADAAGVVHDHIHSDQDEPRSVLDDDSDGEDGDDYIDDDRSSSLSIPNESIDFDLVYSLHSFGATVEGQANVVKGDRLFLIDDSNSYWWLVRVLKTQEVGYIPAENIETPFERLARLNKHRNVDLASATQAEMQGDLNASQDRLRLRTAGGTPSPIPGAGGRGKSETGRRLVFTSIMSVHRYAPAIWDEEEEEEEDVEFDEVEYMATDPDLADDETERLNSRAQSQAQMQADYSGGFGLGVGPVIMHGQAMDVDDDGMQWDESAGTDEVQRPQQQIQARTKATAEGAATGGGTPEALQPGTAQQQSMTRQQPIAQQQLPDQQSVIQQQPQQPQQQWGQQQQQPQKELRTSSSREHLAPPDPLRPGSASPNSRRVVDPLEATETVRKTITPTVARDDDIKIYTSPQQEDERVKRLREEEEETAKKRAKGGKDKSPSISPSPTAVSSQKTLGGKLRKSEPTKEPEEEKESSNGGGKKKRGILGLFGSKKKDKDKDKSKDKNASVTSFDSAEVRASEESGKSSRPSASGSDAGHVMSPTTNLAMQQQQQLQQRQPPSTPERGPHVSQHASQLRQHDQQQQALYQQYLNRSPSSPPEAPSFGLWSAPVVLGPHGPGATGSSASGLGPPTPRPRPGSLILTSSSIDGSLPGVQQELSVIRIFAGKNLQTDATFKTALLNSSTIASDLVRQAIQRFRLPGGEDPSLYYLTVKQVEGGSSSVLQGNENPLVVFETLVSEATEMPKVKRSSMGSISSVSSNLSMHPAIKKLPMNDFTDDSTVKFYLNRRSGEGEDSGDGGEDSMLGHGVEDGDDTAAAEMSHGEMGVLGEMVVQSPKSQYLTVSTGMTVTPERFSSPSIRFPVQLVIYREDLPDDMVFHPTTEAIVFKDQLRESEVSAQASVNPNMRKKVFMFPKNVTVAEVIELGLERFGILEGVVDGGDEIEDKLTKRRSSERVRYGLWVNTNGHERELTPSTKVVDAFPRPPIFRSPDRNGSVKRRSMDSAQLLGNMDDVQPEDPLFFLRRAVSYRSSTSRHRLSAPLDEMALRKMHRESAASSFSQASADSSTLAHGQGHGLHAHVHAPPQRQPSAQEIIAAQRAATRANQMAILSAQSNSLRGTDILLPDNAVLRSSRYDSTERMRYSYVEPGGEVYDISDIVEAEWRDHPGQHGIGSGKGDLLASVVGGGVTGQSQQGLGANLDRVLSRIRSGRAERGEKDGGSVVLSISIEGVDDVDGDRDRVVREREEDDDEDEDEEDDSVVEDTIVVGGEREDKRESHTSMPSVSEYSVNDSIQNAGDASAARSRSITPGSAGLVSRMPGAPSAAIAIAATAGVTVAASRTHAHSRSASSIGSFPEERADRSSPILPRASTSTPTGRPAADRRQPSLASVMSDSTSGYVTPPPHPIPAQIQESPVSFVSSGHTGTSGASRSGGSGTSSRRRGPIIPKDDFGISHMMAIIEYKAAQAKSREGGEREKKAESVNIVDEKLFGTPVDLEKLHPQVRGIFEGGFKMLEEMDKVLDSYMQPSIGAF